MEKKVSVVIPVYNAETSLNQCLDSVCTQTYTNLEILLINDGSRDASLEICRSYAEKDPRIVLSTQENAGPSATRNRAIDMATGDFLAFVDADDYIEPNMFERMISVAEEHDVDMVICNYYEESGGKVWCHSFSQRGGYYDRDACYHVALDVVDNNSRTRIPPYSPIRMVRKAILDAQKLRFNSKVRRSEDYLLWTQVHFAIRSMYLMADEYLYHYMENPTSITRTYLPGYWQMCKLLYAELQDTLPKDREIRRKIQAMLIQRSLVALHNASEADRDQFESDLREVVNDKELIRAAWSVGLVKNSKRARIYAALIILRLKFLIRYVFWKKKG